MFIDWYIYISREEVNIKDKNLFICRLKAYFNFVSKYFNKRHKKRQFCLKGIYWNINAFLLTVSGVFIQNWIQ